MDHPTGPYDANTKLLEHFLKKHPARAAAIMSFLCGLKDVDRVPSEVLHKGMLQILETGFATVRFEHEASPEPGRGPTPFFVNMNAQCPATSAPVDMASTLTPLLVLAPPQAPASTPVHAPASPLASTSAPAPMRALGGIRREGTLTAPFSATGYPVSPSNSLPSSQDNRGSRNSNRVAQSSQKPKRLRPTQRSTVAIAKAKITAIARIERETVIPVRVKSSLRTHPGPTAAVSGMYQEWVVHTSTPALALNLTSPVPSGTRAELREALGIHPVERLTTIRNSDVLEDRVGLCTNVLILNSKSTPIPTSAPGAPVFLVDHIGPFEHTGWAPTVHVFCCVQKGDGKEVYDYMGRYIFRQDTDMRVAGSKWAGLPNEMQRHICRRIEYARDDSASKLCARAYLRAKGAVIDPPAVRALLKCDVRREDRLDRYRKPKGASLHRDLGRAFESGREKLYMYSLQCEAYDEAFCEVLKRRLSDVSV